MTRLFCLLLLLLAVGGCGYRLSADQLAFPDQLSTLRVEMFENRTMEPYLENLMTAQVTRRLQLFPEVRLVEEQAAAEATVTGRIVAYKVEPAAYDGANRVTRYRAIMQLDAGFRRESDGRTLWRGKLLRMQSFSADSDLKRQEELERLAQEQLTVRLAEDLACKLTETF